MKSAREVDTNGWIEIKKNPISKCGVFPYLGSSIPIPGLDPQKFYNVYRPAEELSDPETIESFKLLPWVDDHEMIGPEWDTAAEEKGVHGVTGEEVYFEEPFLYANLKLFSEKLAKEIEKGKKELSPAYTAKWVVKEGVYNGVNYQIILRKIRGNHLASVREGRTGHEVAVLDHKEILNEVSRMEEEKKEIPEFSGLKDIIARLEAVAEKLLGAQEKEQAEVSDENDAMKKEEKFTEDGKEGKPEEETVKDEKEEKPKEGKAMDTAEMSRHIFSQIARRDALVKKAIKHEKVGVFDASEMTLDETTKYIVKKLGLTCPKGHESSVLAGYFAAAVTGAPDNFKSVSGSAMDSKGIKSPQLRKFLHRED